MATTTTASGTGEVLLTIAIPTYNRSSFLRRALESILPQTRPYGSRVEVIVSDNASTDDSQAVVEGFQGQGHSITHLVNGENLGPDQNFLNCFRAARGRYVLLFGDDDVLLEGSLDKVFPLLAGANFGVVYLDLYFFNQDPVSERPRRHMRGPKVYRDTGAFLKAVNIWFTFISGNIVNKELVGTRIDFDDFRDTNLLQLGWTLPALLTAEENLHYHDYLVAAQFDNSGGYRFCEVFGRNLNRIFATLATKYGFDKRHFVALNRIVLKKHLSKYVLSSRNDFGSYQQEDYLEMLHPVFSSYWSYWVFIYPAITWPLSAAKAWCKVARRLARLTGTL